MNSSDPLAQLRDIHLPEPISWWPPAPGWWIVALIIALALVAAIKYIIRHFRRNRYRKEALQELRKINENRGDRSTRDNVEQLAILLRRVAIHACGRELVASLVGSAWLRFLDSKGDTNQFTTGPGQVLADGHYQPHLEADLDQLSQLIEKWIRGIRQC